jgi:hypothetical protein
MTHWKALLILSIGLSLQGCSTVYRQAGLEKVSRSEVAVIEVASCGDECPIIQEIDGAWRGMGLFKEYEVKPGTRTVKFIYVKGGLSGTHGLIVSLDEMLAVVAQFLDRLDDVGQRRMLLMLS